MAVAVYGAFVAGAAGQMPSQIVRSCSPVLNEWGVPLRGTDPSSGLFGIPPEEGALVQILIADGDTIHPPASDGTPDPRNQVVWTSRIGLGCNPSHVHQGKFSAAVTPRPPIGSKIFVRVFNAPSLADSSFYGDSQLFDISGAANPMFDATVPSTLTPLDAADTDADGLNNSWEKSNGTDANAKDTDGDGVTDLDELRAGTDPLDDASYVAFQDIEGQADGTVRLAWDSATGRMYRVESAILTALDQGFDEVLTVEGNGETMTETIQPQNPDAPSLYRLKVESLFEQPFEP